MPDLLGLYRKALDEFGRHVHAVRDDQWSAPTPCTEWDVRALVNHLVVEQLWAPELLDGKTVEEVGDRFEGDRLGADPVGAWDAAARAAREAFARPGALDRQVHLSYGTASAAHYCQEMISDLVVHAWDLARGIGADERLDPELVRFVYDRYAPRADELHQSGLFDAPVQVPQDADPQTKLVALFGRRP